MAALKTQISERLEAEYSGASRSIMKRSLLDQLDKLVKFELPPTLVKAEADQIAHQLWHEDNPEVEGHDHPEIEATDEHKSLAERRVRLGLLLAELGRKNEIEVTDGATSRYLELEGPLTVEVDLGARTGGDRVQFTFEHVREHVPHGVGLLDASHKPVELVSTQHRVLVRKLFGVVALLHSLTERCQERFIGLLVGAVLAGIEHMKPDQIAV